MQILLDTPPPETRAVPRPAAIWPLAAITLAGLLAFAMGTVASADLPADPDGPATSSLVNEAV